MNQHPYLRAYMAGIVVPTMFLLVAMTAFTIARYVYDVPVPIERVVVFPMAVVPNLWGVWNMLYLALRPRRRISIGLFGALLPLLIGFPTGYLVTQIVVEAIPSMVPAWFIFGGPVAVAVYYLAWKYFVGALNRIVGIA